MPKTKKSILPENLERFSVYIDDIDANSRYFHLSEIPEVLTGGKNAFLINGCKELNPTTDVKIEIKDTNGNTIFLAPIKNYQEGLARVVSIEVYEDTPPGQATITILGELRITAEGAPIPAEWVGKYNVRWQRKITVQPTALNRTRIRLYNRPEITVTELLVPYLNPITSSFIQLSSSIDIRAIKTSVFPSLPYSTTRKELSPVQTQIAYYINNASFPFVRNMEGGIIAIPAITKDTITYAPFTTTVIRVINSSSMQVSTAPFNDGVITVPVTMSYQPPPTFGGSALTKSFADVRINKLTTFSGDIARAKIYAKSAEPGSAYQLIEDRRIEAVGLMLVSSNTGERDISIGKFDNSLVLSSYWQAGIADISSGYIVTSSVVMDYTSARIIDGVYNISDSTLSSTDSVIPKYFFGIKNPLSFLGQMEYTFRGTLACFKSTPNFDAVCEVYLSGSAFPTADALGVFVQTFNVGVGKSYTLFDNAGFNINALSDGEAYLNFVVYGGEWHFADISIDSAAETGFNPDEVRIVAPITGRRFERLMFKAELLDPNSNLVPINVESISYYFDGGNTVFQGADHRIEGVMTLAPSGSTDKRNVIRLTTTGFIDAALTSRSGSAITIGDGQIFSPNTPVFLGVDDSGSATFSLSDKLWARTDPITGLFILDIYGTVYVGSGSNRLDIRTLLPNTNSDKFYNRIYGDIAEMKDIRGTYAVTAGEWNSQIARMGYYTRGSDGFTAQTTLNPTSVVSSMDPFTTGSLILTSSVFVTIPANQQVYNSTLYGSMNVGVTEGGIVSGLYLLTYTLDVITSWTGYLTGSAQTLLDVGSTYVAVQGSFSPNPIINYPIFVPTNRGNNNTLYITLRLTVNTTPQS